MREAAFRNMPNLPKSAKRKERRQELKASYLAGMSRKSYKRRSALNRQANGQPETKPDSDTLKI